MKPIKKVCYEGRTNKRNKEGLKKREKTNMKERKDITNRIKKKTQKRMCESSKGKTQKTEEQTNTRKK